MALTLDQAGALKEGDLLRFDNGTDEIYTVVSSKVSGRTVSMVLQRASGELTHATQFDLPKAEIVGQHDHAPAQKSVSDAASAPASAAKDDTDTIMNDEAEPDFKAVVSAPATDKSAALAGENPALAELPAVETRTTKQKAK